MTIRPAKREELPQAAALVDESWRWAYQGILDANGLRALQTQARCQRMQAGFGQGHVPLLLFDGGALLGYCRFGPSQTPGFPEDGEISALYLRQAAVGKGYGRALLLEAERALRGMGYRHLVLDVLSQNARAIASYQAHGYAKAGERRFTWCGKEYPLDIMRKPPTDYFLRREPR